jgi:hypothetical protein
MRLCKSKLQPVRKGHVTMSKSLRSTGLRYLLALLVVGLAPAAAMAQEWKDFSSNECRCSAQFPGTPQQKTQTMQTKVGSLDAKMIMLEVPGAAFYALAFVDYPKDKVGDAKPDGLLDGARDGAVSNVKGKLASETKISMNGYPGRELKIEAPGDLALHARLYMVKERLYQSLVVMPKAKEASGDSKKFLDSFKFQKP